MPVEAVVLGSVRYLIDISTANIVYGGTLN